MNIIKSFGVEIFGFPIYFYFLIFFIFGGIFLIYLFSKGKKTWLDIIYSSYGYILIGGLFAQGKTRMLSMIAFLWKKNKKETFIISNFLNGYSDIFYSSIDDFINILDDLIFLGDYQNFSIGERKNISNNFENYFDEKIFNDFKKKYKYIPTNGYHNSFLLLGDEFHQYFYNMENFFFNSEKGKGLLQTLHQIRHYNTLAVLATQELDELNIKLRRLASYELETEKKFFNLIFSGSFYTRNRKLKYSETDEEKEYRKINKKPILFLNKYFINKFILKINKILFKLYKKFIQNDSDFFRIIPKLNELDFYSKFNVKIQKNTYTKGKIFDVVNSFYKEKNKKYKKILTYQE